MHNDKTTLKDLSIFMAESGGGVFSLIDHTTTLAGRDMLRKHIYSPPDTHELLQQLQDSIRYLSGAQAVWPTVISNGTIVMLEKFFESADNTATPPAVGLALTGFLQKLFNRNEYFFTQFSISHLSDFLKGCTELAGMLSQQDLPPMLRTELQHMQDGLQHPLVQDLAGISKNTSYTQLTRLSYRARRELKSTTFRLIAHYARLDAWHAMAVATQANGWIYPEVLPAIPVWYESKALYHPLLQTPVSYSIDFSNKSNFLLLTGANMSGKTTFMRALGVGALLAHLGMGVPAESMRISFLQGIITNMHVEDDLLRGESYFFAEVQRMKHTATQLLHEAPQLVLMDELFKGTNVHDAYECTRGVVEGLLQHPNHLMILSTHLYEVAQHFGSEAGIQFAHFITNMDDAGGYHFTYRLQPGISNDRIGYRILQKEGVLDLLKRRSGK